MEDIDDYPEWFEIAMEEDWIAYRDETDEKLITFGQASDVHLARCTLCRWEETGPGDTWLDVFNHFKHEHPDYLQVLAMRGGSIG